MQGGPRWGRIVEAGGKRGPLARVVLEIHYGHDEPFEHATWTRVPRGVKPEIGQDVAISKSSGVEATVYEIMWDRPPHYGVPLDEAPSVIDPQLLDAWAKGRTRPVGPVATASASEYRLARLDHVDAECGVSGVALDPLGVSDHRSQEFGNRLERLRSTRRSPARRDRGGRGDRS